MGNAMHLLPCKRADRKDNLKVALWVCTHTHKSALVRCVLEGSTIIYVVANVVPGAHFLGTEVQCLRTATANKSCFDIPTFLAFSTVGLIIAEDS